MVEGGNTLKLNFTGGGGDYGTWASNFPGADLVDPNADYDNDGMNNDQERVFGLDPTKGTSVNPISVQSRRRHLELHPLNLMPAAGDSATLAANWGLVGPLALPAAAYGQSVRLEWRFRGLTGNDSYLGVYIDDVLVTKTAP